LASESATSSHEESSLTPTASGTRLSLVQFGFKPDPEADFGGKMMGGTLVDLSGRIP
jgi:hypothetical protein